MEKKLLNISWLVDESEYRQDPAFSYSTLARFSREGFNKLNTLFTKVDSPSLTFGSAVDSIITGGMEEFNSRFLVAEFPAIKDSIVAVTKALFLKYSNIHHDLIDIPDSNIIDTTKELSFQLNWRPETRAKVIKEQGREYYNILFAARDKQVLDNNTALEVYAAVRALRESPSTHWYFAEDNPFDNIVREYQLKFKAKLDGINYRCMADLLITDNNDKIVYPIDLKTSSHKEWEFYESFVQWCYHIQARLYWRIIRANMDKDSKFKDYKLGNYKFIVINKETLTPLVWEFEDTKAMGNLTYADGKLEFKDPYVLGAQLQYYLNHNSKVPIGIIEKGVNSIKTWLNKN